MRRILVTGMSGTGKSTVVAALADRGFRGIDTDSDAWSVWATDAAGEPDWVWREPELAALLAEDPGQGLFVAGCKTNQGRFHDRFDHVVLLRARPEVMLHRIATRETNAYGRTEEERAMVLRHLVEVEPRLRRAADVAVDTSDLSVGDVVERLAGLAGSAR